LRALNEADMDIEMAGNGSGTLTAQNREYCQSRHVVDGDDVITTKESLDKSEESSISTDLHDEKNENTNEGSIICNHSFELCLMNGDTIEQMISEKKRDVLEGLLHCDDSVDNKTQGKKHGQNRNHEMHDKTSPKFRTLERRGSKTGLTRESELAVVWVHRIPWYLRPVIPAFFNLVNSALRWASLVLVAASTAEMLMSGLELLMSVFASRIIRKRLVSNTRWIGVSILAVGLILVGFANVLQEREKEEKADGENFRQLMIGNLLIFAQCIFSATQDITEEIFLQETDMPATLLLGMEGLFGFIFGVPLYFCFASSFGESPFDTWAVLSSSPLKAGSAVVCLLLLVLITGIFNIIATEVTSSMSRNVWKNFRTILVWVFGLLIFYVGENDDRFGEEWIEPSSFYVLGGFFVMITGVYIYYNE